MRIVPIDAETEPNLDPDLLWTGLVGDLALTAPDAAENPAGLAAGQGLRTAVLICLMTDCRADPTELRDGDSNRGWPGDGFDLQPGETALGSKLWLLRREALRPEIETLAEDFSRVALETLVAQGAFVRFDVAAIADRNRNRLELTVDGYGRDGASVYQDRFAVLWEREGG